MSLRSGISMRVLLQRMEALMPRIRLQYTAGTYLDWKLLTHTEPLQVCPFRECVQFC